MIRLTTNRGPVELESWDDVVSQPGYNSPLDPKHHNLREIIGAYSLRNRHPCGLSTCRTPHLRGYLVVTESGVLTNIGNICGKKHFGIEFQRMARSYRQLAREHENRTTIDATKARLPEFKKQLEVLRDGSNGGKWIYHKLREMKIPYALRKKLLDMAKTGEGQLVQEREARAEEREAFEAMHGRPAPHPYYVEERIGFIRGIEVLRPENCPRKRIICDLESVVMELEKAIPDEMKPIQLRRLAKLCGELDSRFAAARRIVNIGQQFLDVENLVVLNQVIESPVEQKDFRLFLKALGTETRRSLEGC